MDRQIQGVFFLEESDGPLPGLLPDQSRHGLQVAASAETPLPRALKQDQTAVPVGPGGIKALLQSPDHLPIQGIERPGAV